MTSTSLHPRRSGHPSTPLHLFDSAQRKLKELVQAQELGLSVPETLATNSANEAQRFYKKHDGLVLYRDFDTRLVIEGNTKKTFDVGLMNEPVDWGSVEDTPCVFQKFVKKEYDIRVVVVGKKAFACKIFSQDSRKTKSDWRNYDFGAVRYEKTSLPKDLKAPIRKLMKKSNLEMASFDFVVDKKSRHYFLEMNRPGTWLFIEALSGLEISKTIADHLKN